MNKKLLGLLVAGLTVFAMIGCSKPAEGDNSTTPPSNSSTKMDTKTTSPATDAGAPGASTTGATTGTAPTTPPATTTGK